MRTGDHQALGGTRLIMAAATSVTAFLAEVPLGEPVLLHSWHDFAALSTSDTGASYLPDAARGFFLNGGTSAYVIGVGGESSRVARYTAGLAELEVIPEVRIVVAPDLWSSPEDAPVVARAIARHCAALGNRMAVLHTDRGLSPADAVKVPSELGLDEHVAQFLTLYYPWITSGGTGRAAPATGHVAGAWARSDTRGGVQKAPANENLTTVVSLERKLTDAEQGPLNAIGLNCLRSFSGRDALIWGARTLSSDIAWRYVNVRRTANHLWESIRAGTRWAAFEPNDHRLWASLRHTTTAFLAGQWRAGVVKGRTVDDAFSVICDESNNTAESAKVVIDVGVAIIRPAEYVTFRVVQRSLTEQPV
ncbi:phage tail sheath family protein [Allokutzneria oryzae]|uniref:Phage tail sheath family protein n=1 Tax=Allokutzneria oryzae TaxID=1378989 RepID=A0ABV5ZVA1_9PSEU